MGTMYEKIIDVLENNGPTNLTSLYEELNRHSMENHDSLIAMSSIKSVLSRKKDLFYVREDIVSIHPEKDIKKMVVDLRINPFQAFSLHIDFWKENYSIQDWSLHPIVYPPVFHYISSDQYLDLKKELYRTKIWDWTSSDPQNDSIYTVCLYTLNSSYLYKSSDMEGKEWKQLKKIISMFTNLDR
ncbi:MAG TPA: hypothetical protein VNR61_21055 [Niallia sp.]|nr:hypothetical protein [Niallia sp.]